MPFNLGQFLGIDLTGGISTVVTAFQGIGKEIADFRTSEDADIRRRCDLVGLQIQEDLYYLWRNGLIELGVPLPAREQPPPLPVQMEPASKPQ